MYAKVLYDKGARRGLHSGAGFSCLIDGKVLFDAGEDAASLEDNMKRMMVTIDDIEAVVISHEHWDHTGGLWDILKRKRGIKVYVLPSFSEEFKTCVEELGAELVVAGGFTSIYENIYVTGEISGEYKGKEMSEQALVVIGDKGLSVITGCAHPGIVRMVEIASKSVSHGNLYMVFGGFHLEVGDRKEIENIIKGLRGLGVDKAGPSHCSGEKARRIFKGKLHENFIAVKAGHIIHL